MELIRPAQTRDLEAINSIYNHYVPLSDCTMETEPVTMEARRRWFEEHGTEYPIIVAEKDGVVVAWGALSKYRPRAAYQPTVEDTIYVHPDWTGRGIGEALLSELVLLAKERGYHSIIAVINASQVPSLKLHARQGFVEVGVLRQVGFKFGRWMDIKMMQIVL